MSNLTIVTAEDEFYEITQKFNYIVSSVLTILALIFIVLLFVARTMDKDDLRKDGATKLPFGISPKTFCFVLILYTGTKRKARTTANIFCELRGSLGKSGYVPLRDNTRKLYQSGDINSFIITLPKYIGRLTQLYIWSDASGSQSSWYLKRAVLYDVERKGAYYFHGNRWFDVYEGEGKVDGTLFPRKKEHILHGVYLCREKFFKDLRNRHIWLAAFTKISKVKFTRVQRLMCCLSMFAVLGFFVTLLEYTDKITVKGNIEIGSLEIGHLQIILGLLASLLAKPFGSLLVFSFIFTSGKIETNSFLFNRRKRVRRKYLQLEEGTSKSAENFHGNEHKTVHFVDDRTTDSTSDFTATTLIAVPNQKSWRISKRWQFIAWATCSLIAALSLLGTLWFSSFFPLEKSFSWLQACISAFIFSVCITEPCHLFIYSLYFALFVKRPAYEEDIYPDLKECEKKPEEEEEREVVEEKGQDAIDCGLQPPSEEQVKEAREKVNRDRELGEVFKMLLFNILFLALMAVVSLGNRDPATFELKTALDETFNNGNAFKSIINRESFWKWAEKSFVPGLFVHSWYNGWKISAHSTGQISNKENFMIGTPIFRQKRVVRDTCILSELVDDILDECNDVYTDDIEETTPMAAHWTQINRNDVSIASQSPWQHQSSDESNTSYSIWGKIASYNGGGYIAYMGNQIHYAENIVNYLKNTNWVDKYTRAVFVEYATYNGNLNLLGIFELIVEFHNSGGARPRLRSYPQRLYRYKDNSELIFLAGEIVFAFFILQHFYKIAGKINTMKWAFFKNFWNWTDIVLIISSFSMVVLYALRMIDLQAGVELLKSQRSSQLEEMKSRHEYKLFEHKFPFYSFYKVAVWEEYIAYVSSVIFVIPILQFMKFMRFNKNFKIFYATLGLCANDLMSLGVFFLISLSAFSILAIFLLSTSLETFSTFPGAFANTIGMILGKYSYKFFMDYSKYMGIFFVITFTVIHVFLLMNIVLTLISVMFVMVKNDERYNTSEYEIVKFLVIRAKVFLKQGVPPPLLPPAEPVIIRRPTNFTELHWNFHSKYITETQTRRIIIILNGLFLDDFSEDIVLLWTLTKIQRRRKGNVSPKPDFKRSKAPKPRMHCIVTDDIL